MLRFASILLFVAIVGCAPTLVERPSPVIRVEPLPEPDIGTAAALLRLEDRREFASGVIGAAARAPTPAIRARAALAAGRIGGSQGATLVRSLLLDPDSSVAAVAALMAGQLRDTLALGDLAVLLDPLNATARPTVAVEAAGALGRMSDFTARGVLNSFLVTADPNDARLLPVVREALIATWRAGETEPIPYDRWIDHPDPEVRWRAAHGLSRSEGAEAVQLLLPLIDDPDPLARSFAVRGLAAPAVQASAESPTEILNQLVPLLADSAYPVRVEAIRVIASYDHPRAVAALQEILRSQSPHEVVVVLEAVAAFGPHGRLLLADIEGIARNPALPTYLREAAIISGVSIEPAAAPGFLATIAADTDWRIRAAVARGFGRLRTEAVDVLYSLARDEDPRVAAAAVDAAVAGLRPFDVARIRPLLLELAHAPDMHVRAAAIRGLSWLADPATFPLLLDAFDRARADSENVAAIAAIDALAEIGLAGALSPERAFFTRFPRPDDPEIRRRAAVRFPAAARTAWGDLDDGEAPLPGTRYLDIARRWIAPPPALRTYPMVRIEMEQGTVDVVLFGDQAPLTVANFLGLAEAGFFDAQVWARLVPNFVIQGGDPRGDTTGGPGYTIRDEPNRHRFLSGTLGMALSGPDTAGSQFFITQSPQPHLDGAYTAFGSVLRGHELLERILPGDRVISIRPLEDTSRVN
jgi:cyclophilin family peptidyl-prolyl cis-trans isomerase/HEAT repeat protein